MYTSSLKPRPKPKARPPPLPLHPDDRRYYRTPHHHHYFRYLVSPDLDPDRHGRAGPIPRYRHVEQRKVIERCERERSSRSRSRSTCTSSRSCSRSRSRSHSRSPSRSPSRSRYGSRPATDTNPRRDRDKYKYDNHFYPRGARAQAGWEHEADSEEESIDVATRRGGVVVRRAAAAAATAASPTKPASPRHVHFDQNVDKYSDRGDRDGDGDMADYERYYYGHGGRERDGRGIGRREERRSPSSKPLYPDEYRPWYPVGYRPRDVKRKKGR